MLGGKMKVLLFIFSALIAYMVGAINPAIALSKRIYHTDIREHGSKNAGFANFKRVFGNKWAWLVFLLDLLKGAVIAAVFRWRIDSWQLGAAFAGFFAMLGHAYPIWYKFKGGKCVVVYLSVILVVDWRIGLLSIAILLLLLFITKYFSLADIIGALTAPIALIFIGAESVWVILLLFISVVLLVWRHRKNIVRLFNGTEPKTNVKLKK